ncbi:MAG: type II toxin-antitoxin system VapC family toxin [Nitrospira sp. SB0677_bin_15]|nr:type II toxin-antitoxin system VapC family toxin [Nitrospira sp. SB0667_bin_9]MYD30516.1 type II toxin-antitoxin system VapC family toxin [Nitrospira sp. SB0661_bin_20]MYG41491.1 type II toxin-antitoxin system VapC family toxin [Nitrospira sp. SB0677_bin_15]MYJ23752.1 type II toxin-antitoxin system VapC family toxin [Nitrospira sp. SB0673_bin_12]
MPYLLDTNVVSDLVRNPQGQVMQHIREVGEAQVCTSIIVAAELRYGAARKGSARLTKSPAWLSALAQQSFSQVNGPIFACNTGASPAEAATGFPSLSKIAGTPARRCSCHGLIGFGCTSNG